MFSSTTGTPCCRQEFEAEYPDNKKRIMCSNIWSQACRTLRIHRFWGQAFEHLATFNYFQLNVSKKWLDFCIPPFLWSPIIQGPCPPGPFHPRILSPFHPFTLSPKMQQPCKNEGKMLFFISIWVPGCSLMAPKPCEWVRSRLNVHGSYALIHLSLTL